MRSPLRISYFSIFNTELLQIPIYLKYRDTKNRDATNTEIQQIQRYNKYRDTTNSQQKRDATKTEIQRRGIQQLLLLQEIFGYKSFRWEGRAVL